MKICILSDSHDNLALLDSAVEDAQTRGAEAVLHCGDVVAPSTLQVVQKHESAGACHPWQQYRRSLAHDPDGRQSRAA